MASGVPAVVTPGVNLGLEITAADAGWVAGDSPEAFEELVAQVIASEEERRRVGQRARTFAERFRWANVATQLVTVYEALTRQKGGFADLGAARQPASLASS